MRNKKIKKTIIIFFGPPGSGKGTQDEMLSKKIKIPTVSLGDLLRAEINRKTILGKKIAKVLAGGKLVDDKIVEEIIKKRLAKKDAQEGFILDGYPRNKNQNLDLVKILKNYVSPDAIWAILVKVSDKEVKSRLGGRRICDCGANYHLKYKPPKKNGLCDQCGRQLKVRDDDQPQVIAKRLKLYHREIKPILGYWQKEKKLITVNGEQSIREVGREIMKSLKRGLAP